MKCPFCCLLQNYIGQYIRVGIVVNCASDNVIFTACCDDIFELYFLDTAGAAKETIKNIDITTIVDQRLYLLNAVQGNIKEEAKANE